MVIVSLLRDNTNSSGERTVLRRTIRGVVRLRSVFLIAGIERTFSTICPACP